jgi:hypothetical protein
MYQLANILFEETLFIMLFEETWFMFSNVANIIFKIYIVVE